MLVEDKSTQLSLTLTADKSTDTDKDNISSSLFKRAILYHVGVSAYPSGVLDKCISQRSAGAKRTPNLEQSKFKLSKFRNKINK